MLNCINILSKELFDYAGLFPPAQLSLERALNNFAQYQKHPQNSMLGKFILPAGSCNSFSTFLRNNPQYFENFKEKKALFSILLSKSTEFSNSKNLLMLDFQNLEKLFSQTSNHLKIQSVEATIPLNILKDTELIAKYLENLNTIVNNFAENTEIYIEFPFLNNDPSLFLEILSHFNTQHNKIIGLKLRTGGVTMEQIPKAPDLSKVILKACENKLPIKLTAGLHLPVRNFNSAVGAQMHGYLNVICAILFPYIFKDLTSSELEKEHDLLLANEDFNLFKFTKDGLYLGKKLIKIEQLSELKAKYIKGIGTCEFEEPTEALWKKTYQL